MRGRPPGRFAKQVELTLEQVSANANLTNNDLCGRLGVKKTQVVKYLRELLRLGKIRTSVVKHRWGPVWSTVRTIEVIKEST